MISNRKITIIQGQDEQNYDEVTFIFVVLLHSTLVTYYKLQLTNGLYMILLSSCIKKD